VRCRQKTGQGTIIRLGSCGIYSTRLNFSGTEDLGGGTKAGFLLETLFNADTGGFSSGGFAGRTAIGTIQNETYWRLDAGRQATALLEALTYFYMARYGSGNFLYNPNSTLTHNNSLRYASPNLGPVTVVVRYDLGEALGNQGTGRPASAMGLYRQGGAFGLVGYSFSDGPIDINLGDKVKMAIAGFSYDFGVAKPEILIQNFRSELDPRSVNRTITQVGLDVSAGVGTVRAEFETVANHAISHANAKAYSLRYDYPLSKRTTAYTGIAKIQDQSNVYYPIVGASGSSPVAFPIPSRFNGTSPSHDRLALREPLGCEVGYGTVLTVRDVVLIVLDWSTR
jgi:predicted porin